MEAKEFLNRPKYFARRLERLQFSLDEARARALAINCQNMEDERVKNGRDVDVIAESVCAIITLEDKIRAEEARYITAREDVGLAIANVDSARTRWLLATRYLEFREWNDIADELGVTRKYVFKIHSRGINFIQKTLA